jgi:hypothetical protein
MIFKVFSPKKMEEGSWMNSILQRRWLRLSYPIALSHCSFWAISNCLRRAKAIWDFEGIYCSSRHIPHVKFPGLIHPGIIGCAPSAEVSL